MKIGIPKAFLYFKYQHLWESFFESLGIETIVSPDTNKDILNKGINVAVDESCLSSKIYLGHVEWLIGKCDYILVPRVSDLGRAGTTCTKFQAIFDVVRNTFRDRDLKLLYYDIDYKNADSEWKAFMKMGKFLGKKRPQTLYAYLMAKQSERAAQLDAERQQERLLQTCGLKILLVAHGYNAFDKFIGEPIAQALREMGVVPVYAEHVDKKLAIACAEQISDTLPWVFNKELLGAISVFRDRVDGVILMSAFPCGPDSLVNEIIIRRFKDLPILNLMLDGQEGTAGLETRLESFVDIIQYKRELSIG